MKTGIIQQANTGNIQENRLSLKQKIENLARQGAELIVLQELHDSLYFCQTEDTGNFDLAVAIPGEATAFYSEIAKSNRIVLVTSLFEKRAAGLYHNTAVVFDKDGTIAGKYRKMHIPDDPAYYEKFYFTPGDIGFTPIATSIGKLGVLGPMVSGSGKTNGAERCRDTDLSHGNRMGKYRQRRRKTTPTAVLDDFATRTRRR